MPELLPTKAVYAATEPVVVEVRSRPAGPARLVLRRHGSVVGGTDVSGDLVDLGVLEPAAYGVTLTAADQVLARTAVQVVADRTAARSVLRYGFVASYAGGRDLDGVADNVRRLHLTAVQLYDWAYRHADLLGGGEEYADALGNPVSLATVRAVVRRCHDAGAEALGYAAVYGVGAREWPNWERHALRTAGGAAYGLGDFLRLVDPAAPEWLTHFGRDLAAATDELGLDGFHLDQYGYPKQALDHAGRVVDLADRFVAAIDGLRARLGASRLVFNNVNDFPTWATGRAGQDAVYIEVWAPSTRYADLARIVTRAREVGGGKPVCIAAYQHVYDRVSEDAGGAGVPVEEADQATAFTMAALFSHGATHLLAGEADRILVDPYYVRNHVAGPSTAGLLRRWYDFLVEHHDLLMPAAVVDVTASYAGEYNGDLDVGYGPAVTVTATAEAGAVWRRVTATSHGLVVHLVNLTSQPGTEWDAPHPVVSPLAGGQLRVRRVRDVPPEVLVADPDGTGWLAQVPVTVSGEFATAELPPLRTWQLVLVRSR